MSPARAARTAATLLAIPGGLPTAGTEQRSYALGRFPHRAMMRTIKVVDLSSGAFATFVPCVRPMESRYLPWEPGPESKPE